MASESPCSVVTNLFGLPKTSHVDAADARQKYSLTRTRCESVCHHCSHGDLSAVFNLHQLGKASKEAINEAAARVLRVEMEHNVHSQQLLGLDARVCSKTDKETNKQKKNVTKIPPWAQPF